jgi:hypothetical protein
MYEGRNAQLFHPTTGVITWMSHPAQPSFVWQLYHYDLEPNSSLFAVKSASELVHIQYNESNGDLQVINNLPDALTNATARFTAYNLNGAVAYQHGYNITVPPATALSLGQVDLPATLSSVHFFKLELQDTNNKTLSDNFYWRAQPDHQDDLTDLNKLPTVTLESQLSRKDAAGKTLVTVTLHNPSTNIALMAHLQLRRQHTNERVLPVFYSNNYVSLAPNETRTITIEADQKDLHGEDALIAVDGWNISIAPTSAHGVSIEPNLEAQPDHSPATGLPFQTTGLR